MNEKILELLQKIDNRLNGIENEIKEVKTDMNTRFDSIEKKQDILYNQSISTAENITEIREDLGDVQVTTTCNLNDLKELKKLKSVK
ncbi:hypothetical protein ACIJV2_15225 [Clostridioides difficile]